LPGGEAAVEGLAGEAEDAGRATLVAGGLRQDALDVLALDLGERALTLR
jgi:hypothetical protein